MDNTMRRLILENQFSTLRLLYSQMGEMLRGVEKMLLEEDQPEPPVPGFDPKKLYRCRDPEFHAAIHYTDAEGHHYGSIWQTGSPPVTANWDSAGKCTVHKHDVWDLVNYSTPDLDSSCGE